MEKFKINLDDVKNVLQIDKDFQSIEEFYTFLKSKARGIENTDFRRDIKKLIHIISPNQEVKRFNYSDSIDWIKNNCYIGTINNKLEINKSYVEIKENNFEENINFNNIKNDFEKSIYKALIPLEGEELDYAQDITLKEGGVISVQKEFEIYAYKEELKNLDTSKVLLAEDSGNAFLALGYLVKSPDDNTTYTVVFDNKKHILYNRFKNQNQFRLILFGSNDKVYSKVVELNYEKYEIERERPLCIDFGTSNTTVGSFGILNSQKDEAEIVHFIDVTVVPNNTEAALLPTIVYVDDCSDKDNIKYLFGYEARKRIEEEHYESKAAVFYEIKRWISTAEQKENIRDNKNNKACPKRIEIIKAYIDYVIEYAEQYFEKRFEKLHFSAPVNLKGKFLETFSKLYENKKEVLSYEDSIDEGVAIVYNQITDIIYNNLESNENIEKSVMILDCGGGTTDLASCDYSYKKTSKGIELELKTCFENGNSNFGGNNITYRILQLLKIKMVAQYYPELIDDNGEIIKLIDMSENNILMEIENQNNKKSYNSDEANMSVYKKFLDNYKKAEKIIPTVFKNNKIFKGAEELKKIKHNFYYLWRKAEQIKIEFYKSERVLMNFDSNNNDIDLITSDTENYYIYFADEKESRKLQKIDNPFDNINITIKEINRVICGDIYALLVGLFEGGQMTSNGKTVDGFDYYKFSGQSCKISLFSELIKEYIPGRKLRPANGKRRIDMQKSEDLKLDCVLGSINYVRDQMRPGMKVISKQEAPEIIYSVWLKGNRVNDKILFNCNKKDEINIEICDENTVEFPIRITSKDGIIEREFIFRLDEEQEKDELWNTEDITKKILKKGAISEKGVSDFIEKLRETTQSLNGISNLVFVIPANDGYGMYISQLYVNCKDDGPEYKFLQFEYQNYEDASKTFFDGQR